MLVLAIQENETLGLVFYVNKTATKTHCIKMSIQSPYPYQLPDTVGTSLLAC